MTVALVTLLLTIVVETSIALLLSERRLSRFRVIDVSTQRLWIDVPLVNLATHPTATLLVRNGIATFTVVELLVFATEAVLYRSVTHLSWRDAIVLSAIANGTTVLIALALQNGN